MTTHQPTHQPTNRLADLTSHPTSVANAEAHSNLDENELMASCLCVIVVMAWHRIRDILQLLLIQSLKRGFVIGG